jgi:hypothetical protein
MGDHLIHRWRPPHRSGSGHFHGTVLPAGFLILKQKSKAPQRKPRPYVPTRKSMRRPPHPNHSHPLFLLLFIFSSTVLFLLFDWVYYESKRDVVVFWTVFQEKKTVFFATHSRFVLLPVPTFGNFSKFPKVGTGSALREQGGPYSGSTADWCAETASAFEISTPNFKNSIVCSM